MTSFFSAVVALLLGVMRYHIGAAVGDEDSDEELEDELVIELTLAVGVEVALSDCCSLLGVGSGLCSGVQGGVLVSPSQTMLGGEGLILKILRTQHQSQKQGKLNLGKPSN